ncbi:MAG: radical SAM protein [Spirochaetota bacterium]|nr:radical SAM protein [Spirochaetota bacterium]
MKNENSIRQFEILRLSLTENCNYSCFYCVDSNIKNKIPVKEKSLSPSEYAGMVDKINKILNLKAVRLTGGEPTLYKPLVSLVNKLKLVGIPKIHLTTNGSKLYNMIDDLCKAGLNSINISLDAMDPVKYSQISQKGKLKNVLYSVEKAIENDIKVKINCTVMRGINDTEIIPLFKYASDRGIAIRFLELMKMGHLFKGYNEYFFSEEEIINLISKEYNVTKIEREKSATSQYWTTDDNRKFGIIANESSPFCHDCNRLRLDNQGRLYGCLSVNQGFSIVGADENTIKTVLEKAITLKQKDKFVGSNLSMKAIGG